jgi:MFS transporter, FHS family, glucose/mannose:H+ symporter
MIVQKSASSVSIPEQQSRTPFPILGPLFFYFAGAGVANVMLGPLLPSLIERWHIRDAQAGILFTALFAGQLIGAWIASKNLRASVILGAAVTACSSLAMLWAGFYAAHVALFGVGLGLGAGLTAGNVIAGTAVSSGRARILAVLNVGWSLGAIASPALVRILGVRDFFVAVAVLLALAAAIGTRLPKQQPQPIQSAQSTLPLPALPLLAFALALLLYVGIENALGGWLPTYGVRYSPLLLASSIAFYYWMAELIGRLLMALVVRQLGETALYRGSLFLLSASLAVLIFSPHLSAGAIIALTLLCGLTIAPLYPLIVSFLLARTGNHPRLGPLFSMASLGGATLPWLTGLVSTQFYGLRAGLAVPAIGALLLIVTSSYIARKPSPSTTLTPQSPVQSAQLL